MSSKNITTVPSACPECGSDVWDNTKKPKRNPKAPDAACKDKDNCGWAGWLPKQEKAAGGQRVAQTEAWGPLLKRCVQYVKKHVAPEFQNPSEEMIKELATTLFIAGTKERGHMWALPATEASTPAPAPAPPARPAPPVRRADYDDDEIPF